MKKLFKNYAVIWAILFVAFNIIAFVSTGWVGIEKYTVSFWTGCIYYSCFSRTARLRMESIQY